MKNHIVPILIVTAFVTVALAGILYIRANVARPDESVVEESTFDYEQALKSTIGSYIEYVVRTPDANATAYGYFLQSAKTERFGDAGKAAGPARFNQSSDICDTADGFTTLTVRCEYVVDNMLELRAIDGIGQVEKTVLATTFDIASLGFGSAEGYLVPVAVADDKSAIYLGRRVETESYVAGLWKLDVATGEVSEIVYVRENNLYQFDINPATKRLVGVTFVPPESLGDPLTGPTSIHFVDLVTGDGESVMGSAVKSGAFENPMLSDDGLSYAFYASGPLFDEASTVIYGPGETPEGGGTEIDGIMKDWFGDTVVFDRDGNLFLYDLKTDVETRLTSETDATVEYVGVVK